MAITIKGIRVKSLSVNTKPDEEGDTGITATYELLSNADKVLATQSVGGYQGLKITPCPDTIGKLNEFIALYKRDITTVLGLEDAS